MANGNGKLALAKKHWALIAKLVVGVGVIGAGVQEYVALQEQNRLVYQTLSTKVNNMAEVLANIQGQHSILLKLVPGVHHEEMFAPTAHMPRAPSKPPTSKKPKPKPKVEVATEPIPIQRKIDVQAFEQLPANLDDLANEYK